MISDNHLIDVLFVAAKPDAPPRLDELDRLN
jgi:hypothetical protein